MPANLSRSFFFCVCERERVWHPATNSWWHMAFKTPMSSGIFVLRNRNSWVQTKQLSCIIGEESGNARLPPIFQLRNWSSAEFRNYPSMGSQRLSVLGFFFFCTAFFGLTIRSVTCIFLHVSINGSRQNYNLHRLIHLVQILRHCSSDLLGHWTLATSKQEVESFSRPNMGW